MTVSVTVTVTVVVMCLLEYLEEAFARLWIKVQNVAVTESVAVYQCGCE